MLVVLTRYFEEYVPGTVFQTSSVQVAEAEILEFARRYDPQSFHVDPEGAKSGPFGGLIASGWHTAAVCMRLLVDEVFGHTAGMGSPGFDELRWTAPVRPDDVLRVRLTVLEARVSNSRPDRGLVKFKMEALNQDGVVAMWGVGTGIVARRPA